MKFLGIDLGWSSGASGLCCLQWQGEYLWVLDWQRKLETSDILAWIDQWAPGNEPALVAVDAPTLISNSTGMRLCDRLTHRYYGRYDAGCYPANLNRPFAKRTVQFGLSLESRGFNHAPTLIPQQGGRHQIEVYPHPATVQLFQLDCIIKYKKGKLEDRRQELEKLRHHLRTTLPILEPPLRYNPQTADNIPIPSPISPVLDHPLPATASLLKASEDLLDSLICAYVGAHWWYWGDEKNQVLGDRDTGYIIIPTKSKLRASVF